MRKVQVNIEGQRLELFEDEKIQINSSVQNVQDIAKVFTDYSQSFTVPATPHNNQIFEHFYQTDVNGTLDYQVRRDANIEIDLIPFRTGKIQLEKANLKNGMPHSYSITFYGDLRSLADLIGDDKLASLDMSTYLVPLQGSAILDRVVDNVDYDVMFPLISSSRLWSYGDGSNTDVNTSAHAINYNELFPAIKIIRIFDRIEAKYGIGFQGLFLQNKRFTDCYLYLKNKETFVVLSPSVDVDFNESDPTSSGFFNITTNELYIRHLGDPTGSASHKIIVAIIINSLVAGTEGIYLSLIHI